MKSKKEKEKEKKMRLKKKLGVKCAKMKGVAKAVVNLLLLTLFGVALVGCQSADPASRSNRTRYGDIVANVQGENNAVYIEIGDGLYASADGGGDATTSTPTQTTETKPEIAAAWGGASAGTGGAKPTSGLTETVIAAWQKLTSGQKLTAQEAAAIKDCAEGNCE